MLVQVAGMTLFSPAANGTRNIFEDYMRHCLQPSTFGKFGLILVCLVHFSSSSRFIMYRDIWNNNNNNNRER